MGGACSNAVVDIEPSYEQPNAAIQRHEWIQLVDELNSNTALNEYVLSKGRKKFKKVQDLIKFLHAAPVESEIERVWCIYVWIAHNIDYNFDGLKSGSYGAQDVDSVLKTGQSVCAGYSNLFCMLCDSFSIRAVSIIGYSKGYGYEIGKKLKDESADHDWNAVYVDNRWNFIESTWAAGYGNDDEGFVRKFQPYYFFMPPEVFIYEHFPDNKQFQLLQRPISLEEFEMLPCFKLNFFIHRFKCLSHSQAIIDTRRMVFHAPDEMTITASLFLKNKKLPESSILVQRNPWSSNIELDVSFQSKKESKLSVFGGLKGSKSFDCIAEFLLLPNTTADSTLFCKSYSFPRDVYLFEPKDARLSVNSSHVFKVYVDAANEVVINDSEGNLSHLKRVDKDFWLTEYTPKVKGKLKLGARLSEKNMFAIAFEYTVE